VNGKKYLLLAFLCFWIASFALAGDNTFSTGSHNGKVNITIFYSKTCAYCHRTLLLLDDLSAQNPSLKVEKVEVYSSRENTQRWVNAWRAYGYDPNYISVPLTVIDGTPIVGYDPEKIRSLIETCILTHDENKPCSHDTNTNAIHHFFFGEINIRGMSLPVLAAVLGLADGFNPCAMVVLVYLIALIIETKDKKKMWLIVGTFVFASASLYLLFLTAWLHVLLNIGTQPLIQLIIGIVAIAAGIFSLKNHLRQKEATCKVTSKGTKEKILNKFNSLLKNPTTPLTILWIVFLAFAVNAIEFICSAFIPLVFTEKLAISNISMIERYGYILLYDFFYMLDDIVLFAGAALTLSFVDVTDKYARIAGIAGGLLMLLLGVMLVFFPEALALI